MSENTIIPPITIGAESIRTELAEAPEAHGLTPAQAARITALSDNELNQAVQRVVDDDFWAFYDALRSEAISQLTDDPLVCVVFVQGQDYEDAVDAANALGGSTEAVVEHLAQWDYGDETDGAAEVNGHTQLIELENNIHQLHEVDFGGLHYWLELDHHLGIYGLYRRPLHS